MKNCSNYKRGIKSDVIEDIKSGNLGPARRETPLNTLGLYVPIYVPIDTDWGGVCCDAM